MISEKVLHRIILMLPGLAVATTFLFLREFKTALTLFVFDITGAFVGSWWLGFSEKIAGCLHKNLEKRGDNYGKEAKTA